MKGGYSCLRTNVISTIQRAWNSFYKLNKTSTNILRSAGQNFRTQVAPNKSILNYIIQNLDPQPVLLQDVFQLAENYF